MKKRLLVSIFIFCACLAYAFEWPVENKLLVSTFGGNDGKHFQTGIELSSKEQPVFPIAEGEVLFYYVEGSNYRSLPRGNGSLIVLQHEGDIQSVYSHLAPGSIEQARKRIKVRPLALEQAAVEKVKTTQVLSKEEQSLLDKGLVKQDNNYIFNKDLGISERTHLWRLFSKSDAFTYVGFMGDGMDADNAHLYLNIFDVKEDLILNPLNKNKERSLLIPPLEYKRDIATGPLVKQVLLRRGTGKAAQYEVITNNQLIKPGEVELVVNTFAGVHHGKQDYKMAPFKFTVFLSGREISSLNFYALEEKNGTLVIWKTDIKCGELYSGDWMYKLARLNLVEGNVNLQIKVEDIFGLETASEYNLRVTP